MALVQMQRCLGWRAGRPWGGMAHALWGGGQQQQQELPLRRTHGGAAGAKSTRPRGYWMDVGHRRRFLEELKEKMGVRKASDWTGVSAADAVALPGGSRFLRYYGDSLIDAVCELYGPQLTDGEVELLQRSRSRRPKGHWDDEENVRRWVQETAAAIGITSVAEWSRMSLRQVSALGGAGLLKRMSLRDALALCYSEEELASMEGMAPATAPAKRSSQWHLSRSVASIFGPLSGGGLLQADC